MTRSLPSRQAALRSWHLLLAAVALAAVGALAVTVTRYHRALEAQRRDLASESARIAASLAHEFELQSFSVRALAVQAEALLSGQAAATFDVVPFLAPFPQRQGYALQQPPGFEERDVGSLTGGGPIPPPDGPVAADLRVAFALTPALRAAVTETSEVAWAYFISQSGFLYIYPRASPEAAFWSPELMAQHSSHDGAPLERGRLYWSKVYQDQAGKGLMTTVSQPVFRGGELRGSVSIDLSMVRVGQLLRGNLPAHARVRLVDREGRDLLDPGLIDTAHAAGPPTAGEPATGETSITVPLPTGWSLQVATSDGDLRSIALGEALPSGAVLLLVLAGVGVIAALRRALRAAEQEVEQQVLELERRNVVLLAAREQADRANRAKSDFVATVSHEIRNPLTGVIGLAAALADDQDLKRVHAGLQLLHQSAEGLRAVLTDVLDFTKLEAGALELEHVPFDAGGAMRSVVELMRPRAAEQGTAVEAELDASVPPWLRGDPTRFRQIVLNLVSNAVKFTEGGVVRCALRYEAGRLTLGVTDTGIGISPDQQQRLFAPFAQAERSTTRRYGGTGLGLSIIRRLVEAMHGELALQSAVGQGSTFTVSLPAPRCEAPDARERGWEGAGRPLRVLLVDDNAVNRLVFTRLLEKLGHRVKTEPDGARAIDQLAQEAFDVVLMDCQMPVMDGFDATRRLRARGDQVPIVALTGAATVEERERCFAAGMNGFLAKPTDAQTLRATLDAVLPG